MFVPAAFFVNRLGAVERRIASSVDTSTPSDQIRDFDSFIGESFDDEALAAHDGDGSSGGGGGGGAKRRTSWREWLLVGAGALYLLFYVGTEIGAGGYIDAFGVKIGQFGKARSAFLNAGYWATFSIGRILAIFVSMRVKPGKILLGSMLVSNKIISLCL